MNIIKELEQESLKLHDMADELEQKSKKYL